MTAKVRRLYQKLVKGEESVIQLFGFTDERRGPSSVAIGAIPKPEKDLSRIRETIMQEILDIARKRAACRRDAKTSQSINKRHVQRVSIFDEQSAADLPNILYMTAIRI